MAIISSYPTIIPTASDLVVITDMSEVKKPTKTATVGSIAGIANISAAYTVYTALLTQTGTNAPVATLLQNNTGATFTWARTGSGTYTITASSNAFTSNKTIVFYNLGEYATFSIAQPWTRTSDTVITISLGGDGRITNGSFEIRIYS
jgi:hypothetical protein|tara:strand:- start:1552 stop:1995 length:444 start_codon:yes stop_codon:yes gene_type:complete